MSDFGHGLPKQNQAMWLHGATKGMPSEEWSAGAAQRPAGQRSIWASGLIVPAANEASHELYADIVYASVANDLSPKTIYLRWQPRTHRSLQTSRPKPLDSTVHAPIGSGRDGRPLVLERVGSGFGWWGSPLRFTCNVDCLALAVGAT